MIESLVRRFKFKLCIVLIILLPCIFAGYGNIVYAVDYAPSYNYSYWNDAVAAPAAYKAAAIMDGKQIGVGGLTEPNDIFVSNNNQVYILDSGNNRVIVTDSSFKLIDIFDSFSNNGETDKFSKPQGIFVTGKDMYILQIPRTKGLCIWIRIMNWLRLLILRSQICYQKILNLSLQN